MLKNTTSKNAFWTFADNEIRRRKMKKYLVLALVGMMMLPVSVSASAYPSAKELKREVRVAAGKADKARERLYKAERILEEYQGRLCLAENRVELLLNELKWYETEREHGNSHTPAGYTSTRQKLKTAEAEVKRLQMKIRKTHVKIKKRMTSYDKAVYRYRKALRKLRRCREPGVYILPMYSI